MLYSRNKLATKFQAILGENMIQTEGRSTEFKIWMDEPSLFRIKPHIAQFSERSHGPSCIFPVAAKQRPNPCF